MLSHMKKRLSDILIGAALVAVLLPAAIIILGDMAVSPYAKYVVSEPDTPAKSGTDEPPQDIQIGMVLGSMVTKQGKPYKELQARLDVAAAAYQRGQVKKLILSGDNRFEHYDEPTAMMNYLINTHEIPKAALQRDFAGRSTYESCQRAKQVFGQDRLILFSAETHLPRAVYLCRHFGIEAYGIASHTEANNATRRELVANVKALYNVYIKGERTILGAPISIK